MPSIVSYQKEKIITFQFQVQSVSDIQYCALGVAELEASEDHVCLCLPVSNLLCSDSVSSSPSATLVLKLPLEMFFNPLAIFGASKASTFVYEELVVGVINFHDLFHCFFGSFSTTISLPESENQIPACPPLSCLTIPICRKTLYLQS